MDARPLPNVLEVRLIAGRDLPVMDKRLMGSGGSRQGGVFVEHVLLCCRGSLC